MIQMPHPFLGLTRLEFEDAGIAFRLWTRPVVSEGGRVVAPVTLLWRHGDGTTGRRHCSGIVEATGYVARVIEEAAGDRLLTR